MSARGAVTLTPHAPLERIQTELELDGFVRAGWPEAKLEQSWDLRQDSCAEFVTTELELDAKAQAERSSE